MIDYLNDLRESCLDAYSGILNGLKGDDETVNNPNLAGMLPHIGYIIQFITVIEQDSEKSEASITSAVGLVG